MAIKLVTDSTSDLPSDLAESLGVTVVPLNVHFGTEVFKDGVDLPPDEFYRRLTDGPELPKTSQPSVGDFVQVYEQLGKDADGILSVHISSKLSGTLNAAVQAKAQANVGCPIETVDTQRASMGVGMVAIAAARAAQQGVGLEEAAKVATQAVGRCQCVALFDTLEYLEKGGRIGKARALLGTLLRIKPLITLRDGEVHELGKERTRAKGVARLQRVAREFGPFEEMSVMYNTTPDEADEVARSLSDLLVEGREPVIARFGPAIGTYAGPGALGVGLLQAQEQA